MAAVSHIIPALSGLEPTINVKSLNGRYEIAEYTVNWRPALINKQQYYDF